MSFLVGREGVDSRREFAANSTVLAVASPYFRAMCFGPMKNDKQKAS